LEVLMWWHTPARLRNSQLFERWLVAVQLTQANLTKRVLLGPHRIGGQAGPASSLPVNLSDSRS
jgi:hypothetical protein